VDPVEEEARQHCRPGPQILPASRQLVRRPHDFELWLARRELRLQEARREKQV
jgi:hypothetical protein